MAKNYDRTESNRKYYEKNKEKWRTWNSNWRRRNPEKVREYNRRYYMKHKGKKEQNGGSED